MRQPARQRHLAFFLVLIATATGCEIRTRLGTDPTDAARSPDASPPDGSAAPDAPSQDLAPIEAGTAPDGAGGGDVTHGGGGTPDGGIDQGVVLACVPNSAPQVPDAPVRRLTNFEYDNTVGDILGDFSRPATALLPFDGYQFQIASGVSSLLLDGYHQLAHDLAIKATKDAAAIQSLTKCDLAAEGEAACQETFIDTFVPSAFRRPLEPADRTDFEAVFAKGRELTGDFAGGVRAVVEVALQSPEFLYRIELGQPVEPALPSVARLTPHETAARLSYLLWGSSPDIVLRDAAAAGKLQTKEQIAVEARRMLTDSRARDVVRYFYLQLLNLNYPGVLESLASAANSPPFTPQMPALLLKETSDFIDEVTWQGAGDFQSLLTAPFTFMNAPLAQYYGVSGVTGEAFQKVAVDARRGGILTQASVLASGSSLVRHSPVMRGLLILRQFLCLTLPDPPAVVPPLLPPLPEPSTTRQKFEHHLSDATCRGCHRDIDPLGFAFEHFDRFGLWRDAENGLAIDATGEIYRTDAAGKFDGALGLIARLVQSRDAQNCYVGNWMRFGYGRAATSQDACSVRLLQDAFAESKGNVRELLVSLTQTDAFLYRSAP
jgi:hypothetical protein